MLLHPLNGALPGPYVPVRVTRGALVTHRYTYAPPRCRTSQYNRTFIPLSVSLWNDLATPNSMVWDWRVSSAGQCFFIGLSCYIPTIIFYYFIIIIIIIKRGWQCKDGRERLTPYQSEDPNPTTATHRKKEEKGKTVGDKKGASS